MNSKILSIIIVLVLIIVGVLLFQGRSAAPTDLDINGASGETMTENDEESTDGDEVAPSVKEFTVEASNFSFVPADITVNEGDTVRITLVNDAGVHDLMIDEFSAATRMLNAGESQTIEFVADQTGSFEYYCSVGNHRAMGMVGTLTVN